MKRKGERERERKSKERGREREKGKKREKLRGSVSCEYQSESVVYSEGGSELS